jgi:hypothetical protein
MQNRAIDNAEMNFLGFMMKGNLNYFSKYVYEGYGKSPGK